MKKDPRINAKTLTWGGYLVMFLLTAFVCSAALVVYMAQTGVPENRLFIFSMVGLVLALSAAALFSTSLSASAAEYKFDKEGQHAFVQFRIQHLGYSWLYGTFKDFDGGDYTFRSFSPLRDAGVMLPWMENALDLAGAKRLVGKPDIGCYESQAQPATVIQLR